jgi:hypothetical protein
MSRDQYVLDGAGNVRVLLFMVNSDAHLGSTNDQSWRSLRACTSCSAYIGGDPRTLLRIDGDPSGNFRGARVPPPSERIADLGSWCADPGQLVVSIPPTASDLKSHSPSKNARSPRGCLQSVLDVRNGRSTHFRTLKAGCESVAGSAPPEM